MSKEFRMLDKAYNGRMTNLTDMGTKTIISKETNIYCPISSEHKIVSSNGRYYCKICQVWWHK